MKHKLNKLLTVFCLMFFTVNSGLNNSVLAKDINSEENYINEKIASTGFGKISNNDPKIEITNLFEKMDGASQKKDIKRMKSFYSEDFISNDGYSLDVYYDAVNDAIKDLKFNSVKTEIKNITISGNYAYAHVVENIEGETLEAESPYKDTALLLSCSELIYTLKKEGKNWKIYASEAIDETSSFLYGDAKNIFFSIQVPNYIKNGTEYTASLTHSPVREDAIVMASVSAHPITYPTPVHEDKFKYVKDNCGLERVLVANSDNFNENVIAVAHISKAKLIRTNEVDVQPLGSAYIIKRVNVINTKKQLCPAKTTKAAKVKKQKISFFKKKKCKINHSIQDNKQDNGTDIEKEKKGDK